MFSAHPCVETLCERTTVPLACAFSASDVYCGSGASHSLGPRSLPSFEQSLPFSSRQTPLLKTGIGRHSDCGCAAAKFAAISANVSVVVPSLDKVLFTEDSVRDLLDGNRPTRTQAVQDRIISETHSSRCSEPGFPPESMFTLTGIPSRSGCVPSRA